MNTDNQNLSYFDRSERDEIELLMKIQSIQSKIYPDRILAKQDRHRFFYLAEVELDRIKIEQRIVVREKDEALIGKLKPQIESEGLIEPLTLLDLGNNQFLLIAGQHRYHVLRQLGVDKAPAKIYLNLALHEQLTLGYMSNEARKDPPAGRKYGALNEIYHEIETKLTNELKRKPAELEVINQMYMSRIPRVSKIREREILIGMMTDNLMNNPDCMVSKYKLISVRQVPKNKIVSLIVDRQKNNKIANFPFLTSKNTFYGLSHLVRTSAITLDEEKTGKNIRHLEFQNVMTFFDVLITKHILPWIELPKPEIEAPMNIFKRHIFETFCKLIAQRLRDNGFDIQSKDGTKAPLFTDKKIPWNSIFEEIEPFFTPSFLNNPTISNERSLDVLWNRIEWFVLVKPGRMPPF